MIKSFHDCRKMGILPPLAFNTAMNADEKFKAGKAVFHVVSSQQMKI